MKIKHTLHPSFLALLALSSAIAAGQPVTWNPAVTGSGKNWSDGGNWLGGQAPSADSPVLIQSDADNLLITNTSSAGEVVLEKRGGQGFLMLQVDNRSVEFDSLRLTQSHAQSGGGQAVLQIAGNQTLSVAKKFELSNNTASDNVAELRLLPGSTLRAESMVLGSNRHFQGNTVATAGIRIRGADRATTVMDVPQVRFDGGSSYLSFRQASPASTIEFTGKVSLERIDFSGNVIEFNVAAAADQTHTTRIGGEFRALDGVVTITRNAELLVMGKTTLGSNVVLNFVDRPGGLQTQAAAFNGGLEVLRGAILDFSESRDSVNFLIKGGLTLDGGATLSIPAGGPVQFTVTSGDVTLLPGRVLNLAPVQLVFGQAPQTIRTASVNASDNFGLGELVLNASQLSLISTSASSRDRAVLSTVGLHLSGHSRIKLNGNAFFLNGRMLTPGEYTSEKFRQLGLQSAFKGEGNLRIEP